MAFRERVRIKMKPSLGTLACVGIAFASGVVAPSTLATSRWGSTDDLTIVFKSMGARAERTTTHYYTADRARMDQGEVEIIVEFATGKVVHILNRKKLFYETTLEKIEEAMTSTSAEMEKAMAGIPEGLRAKMIGDAAGEITLAKGGRRTIAGATCQEFFVALGEKTHIEICAATDLTPPFDSRHFKDLPLATAPMGRGNSGISKLVRKLREIDGLILASSASLRLFGRKMDNSSEATEIKRGPLDPSLFDVPAGYTKVDSPFARTAR